jgi:hypothetical protein
MIDIHVSGMAMRGRTIGPDPWDFLSGTRRSMDILAHARATV